MRAAETFSAEPWRAEWWRTAESVTDALTHAKSISGKSSRCAVMTTYVDDCDLDAAKPLRSLVWKVVRTQFAAKDPVQMQTFLGVVRDACNGTSSCHGLRLTQSDYAAKVLEDAVKLGFGPICVCTTAGQSGTPPDPKLLPEQPCDPGVRELVGVCCFCHAAHVSISPLSLHDLRGLSYVGANGLERKSGTFSISLLTHLDGLSSSKVRMTTGRS